MQFSALVGQAELKKKLVREVTQDHMGHAQLFLGKAGYGGLPLALALTQYVFCENKKSDDSCGECAQCTKVESHMHPDVHFMFPTVQTLSKTSDGFIAEWRELLQEHSYFELIDWIKKMDPRERKPIIGVAQSEEIIKKLGFHAYEGGDKIVIIWMPEEMNQQCANKLLKIIEEPPKNTYFFMVGESQESLLPTIISRAQIVNVPRIQSESLVNYFQGNRAGKEEVESTVARVEGDLIEARNILEDFEGEDFYRDQFVQLMRVCFKKDVLKMLEWAETMGTSTKETQKQFLEYGLHMYRQSLLKNYTDDQLIKVSENENNFLQNFSKFITGNNIEGLLELFNDSHYYVLRNANTKLLFTDLCFKVMRLIHQA